MFYVSRFVVTTLPMVDLDQFRHAQSLQAFAAHGGAVDVASLHGPHHGGLFSLGTDRLYNAKVSDYLVLPRLDVWWKVQEVLIVAFGVEVEICWHHCVHAIGRAENTGEVYMLATPLEYIEGVRSQKEEGLEQG